MHDIVIVGGGITGAATAYWLAREGAKVVVIEARHLAAMGSGWSLGGVRQSGRDPAELELARAAVALWPSLDEQLGAPTGYRQKGNLRLARTPAEIEVIRALVASQRAQGLDLRFLPDTKSVHEIAPALSGNVLAASFCPTDGHADPAGTTRAFAAAARRQGCEIREGVAARAIRVANGRVQGVETSDGLLPCRTAIVATGIHAPELLSPLGLTLPLQSNIVTVLQTVPLPPTLAQVLGAANADCAGRQEVDGRLRVTTGIGAWGGDVARWTEAGLAPSAGVVARKIERLGHVLPALLDAGVHRMWGGIIDLTPDALPVIDATTGIDGLVVAAGFSGHGFGIGPVTGQILSDLALGRRPRLDISAFRLARFAGRAAGQAPLTLHG